MGSQRLEGKEGQKLGITTTSRSLLVEETGLSYNDDDHHDHDGPPMIGASWRPLRDSGWAQREATLKLLTGHFAMIENWDSC